MTKLNVTITILILSAVLFGVIYTASFWEGLGRGLYNLSMIWRIEPTESKLAEGSAGRQSEEDSVPLDTITDTDPDISSSAPSSFDDWGLMEKINYIKEQAEYYGVDPKLARRIAVCESYDPMFNTCHCVSGNPFQNNCVEDCRQGIGIFKITQTTFDEQCEGNPKDIKDNIDCGIKMMSKNQYSRWNQSKHCWGIN